MKSNKIMLIKIKFISIVYIMSNYGGIHWDNTESIYEISGGDLKIEEFVYFKKNGRRFDGRYNSITNTPHLGLQYSWF
jgi:hypothetical protein